MNEKTIHIFSIILITFFGAFIVWLYTSEPKNLAEITSKAAVTVGTYEINKDKFNQGLQHFRTENYAVARDFFNQADTEKRDANTQFYIAYSFYRQGFGKVFNDDKLFKQGLEIINKTDVNFSSNDPDLKLKTPAELKNEFEEGLKLTSDDFNPLKVMRERK